MYYLFIWMQSLLPGGWENRIQNEAINNKVRVGEIIISQILKLVNREKNNQENMDFLVKRLIRENIE